MPAVNGWIEGIFNEIINNKISKTRYNMGELLIEVHS